jgi:hypothetical protein
VSRDTRLIYIVFLKQAKSVPEVLRPLYESPKILAQKMTAAVCLTVHSYCFDMHLLGFYGTPESVVLTNAPVTCTGSCTGIATH